MLDNFPDRGRTADPDSGPDDAPPPLHGVLLRRRRRPDEYTVYPPALDDVDLLTTWMTAREGSFVDLAEMR